jgi:hypothetical protein
MAQTTTAVSAVTTEVEISTNGTTWTGFGGSMVAVDPSSQERAIGQANTLEGDKPIVMRGKFGTIDITLRFLYTPTTGEAFEVLRGVHETVGGADIYLRWSPMGGGAGDQQFSTGKANLKSFRYPGADAGSADPIACEAVITATGITTETVGTGG